MENSNDNLFGEEFLLTLTIEGTQYEEIEMEVTDPMKTIREQINSIVDIFHLPKMDNGGIPITYLLGRIEDDSDCPCILELDDADGREQTLLDYNVRPHDHLHLISRAIAYACPIPIEMQNEWIQYFLHRSNALCKKASTK